MDDVRYQCASVNGLWYPVKKPGDIVHQDEYLGEIRDMREMYRKSVVQTWMV